MKIGNATLVISWNTYDTGDDDMVGGGTITVRARDWVRVFGRNGFSEYGISQREVLDLFKDNKDAKVELTNDDWIVFLNAASTDPRYKYEVDFSGLPYWFWHDVIHAQNDVQGGSIAVDDQSENRALYEGAVLALAKGVPLADIVRELVKAEVEYERRFSCPTKALDRFLRELKVSV
jgi:hypothetical protein